MNKYILNISIIINKAYFINSITNIIKNKINNDNIIKNKKYYSLDDSIKIIWECDEINNYFFTNSDYDFVNVNKYLECIFKNLEYNIKLTSPEFSNTWNIEYNLITKI